MILRSDSDWNLSMALLLWSRPKLPSIRADAMLRLDKAHARESKVLVQNEKTRLSIDKQNTGSESIPLSYLLMGFASGCRLCSSWTRLLTTLSIFEDHPGLDTVDALRSMSPPSSSPGTSATPTPVQDLGVLVSQQTRLCNENEPVFRHRVLLSSAAHSGQYLDSPLSAKLELCIRSPGKSSKHLLQTVLLDTGTRASAGSGLEPRSCSPWLQTCLI